MVRTLWLLAAVAGAAAGCGGETSGLDDGSVTDRPIDSPDDPPIDAPPIDGPVDAATDAAGCGSDLRLVGQYMDWDSTNAAPIGIGGSQWTVVGDLARTTMTQPSGVVSMCLNPGGPSQISVAGPGTYIPALFLADPAVFSPVGSRFEARGLSSVANATTQYAEFTTRGYNAGFAHVLVYKIGAPIPLALAPAINPPQEVFVSDGLNDITWSAGDTGTLTLFPNRPFGNGTATLSSTVAFLGPTTIPIASGRFTIVVIR